MRKALFCYKSRREHPGCLICWWGGVQASPCASQAASGSQLCFKMQSESIAGPSRRISAILDNICHPAYCRGIAFEITAHFCPVATFPSSTFYLCAPPPPPELKHWRRAEMNITWPFLFFCPTGRLFFCARLNFVLNVTLTDGAVTLEAGGGDKVKEQKWRDRRTDVHQHQWL